MVLDDNFGAGGRDNSNCSSAALTEYNTCFGRGATQKNLCNEKLLRLDAVIIFKRGCCHFGFLSGQCIQFGFCTKGLEILSSNYQKFPTFSSFLIQLDGLHKEKRCWQHGPPVIVRSFTQGYKENKHTAVVAPSPFFLPQKCNKINNPALFGKKEEFRNGSWQKSLDWQRDGTKRWKPWDWSHKIVMRHTRRKKLFVILRQIAAALGWTIKDVDWWCKVSVDGVAVAVRVQLFVVL